jgi:hypothetical protein
VCAKTFVDLNLTLFAAICQRTPKAQGFLFSLRVLRSFGNGALESLDQLGDG